MPSWLIIHHLLLLFCLFSFGLLCLLFFSCCAFLCHSLFRLHQSLLRRWADKLIKHLVNSRLVARIKHFGRMTIPCCLLLQLRQNRMGLGAMTRCLHGLLIGI